MAMKDWDFGYLGKGLEGYMHYKQVFDSSFGADTDTSSGDEYDAADDFDSVEYENLEDLQDEVDDLQNSLMDLQNELNNFELSNAEEQQDEFQFDDGSTHFQFSNAGTDEYPISVSVSIGWGDESEEDRQPLPPPPKPLPENYDLTPHFCEGDKGYEFELGLRKAMCQYFPEYGESYANTDKFNDEIIGEIFEVDRPLAFKMWTWQLEHFDSALKNPEMAHTLTAMGYLGSDDFKWLYDTQKQNEWLWKKLFFESACIYDRHTRFLQYALIDGDVRFFDFLMWLYLANKSIRDDSSYPLDKMLEEIMECWMGDFAPAAAKALDRFIEKVDGALRRKVLQKRRASAMNEDDDEDDIEVEMPAPARMTRECCRQITEEKYKAQPLSKEERFVDVTYVAGLFASDKNVVNSITQNDVLNLCREPENAYDEYAVLVENATGNKVGYIPKQDNCLIAQLMDYGATFYAKVVVCPTDRDNNLWVEIIQNGYKG